jgi:hypothetical protein
MGAGDDQIERWQESERDLRAVLAAADLPPAAALQVEEYLDHNELGLAFEAIVFEVDAGRTTVSAETLDRLRATVKRIGTSAFDADHLAAWERL